MQPQFSHPSPPAPHHDACAANNAASPCTAPNFSPAPRSQNLHQDKNLAGPPPCTDCTECCKPSAPMNPLATHPCPPACRAPAYLFQLPRPAIGPVASMHVPPCSVCAGLRGACAVFHAPRPPLSPARLMPLLLLPLPALCCSALPTCVIMSLWPCTNTHPAAGSLLFLGILGKTAILHSMCPRPLPPRCIVDSSHQDEVEGERTGCPDASVIGRPSWPPIQ